MAAIDTNKVKQSGINTAGGDVAGRDLTKHITNHVYNAPAVYREDKRLRTLVEEHERELKLNTRYREFSHQLNDFMNKKIPVNGVIRDLEQKLIDGGRSTEIEYAMELKEKITKKIMRNTHFESAQKIYTHLLADVRTIFKQEVSVRIKSSDFSDYQINDEIVNRIIEPILANVEGCSLYIDRSEVYGLLYILTGNCYVEWDLK